VNNCAMSLFLALAICLVPCKLPAQTPASSPCALEPPDFTTNAPNIFNDRQEQDLGDAMAEYFESDMRIAPPAADDELTRIGEKMLATLPATGIHYRFRIYDSGEVNAFSLTGGRVYVSRKLIAAVKSEDELAGVVAHEIGHLSTHQTSIRMTYWFKVRMGVTAVGDRADIFAKVHQFLSTPSKDVEAERNETKDEIVADHVALYALVRAGYAAESFPAFFNQISMNQGKTGNWFTDAFGLTHEDSRRYREAMKLIGELPAGCAGKQTTSSAEFLAWQRDTVDERVKEAAESATGDKPIHLDPPLRPSLWRVRFSPDGKYVLTHSRGDKGAAHDHRSFEGLRCRGFRPVCIQSFGGLAASHNRHLGQENRRKRLERRAVSGPIGLDRKHAHSSSAGAAALAARRCILAGRQVSGCLAA